MTNERYPYEVFPPYNTSTLEKSRSALAIKGLRSRAECQYSTFDQHIDSFKREIITEISEEIDRGFREISKNIDDKFTNLENSNKKYWKKLQSLVCKATVVIPTGSSILGDGESKD